MRTLFTGLALGLMLVSSSFFVLPPRQINGVVKDAASGKIIDKAHVYIVLGEEEAVTGKDGKFSISTQKEFPLELKVQHPGYKQSKVVVEKLPAEIEISLQSR
ncbi:MAG TPA: carboxypeptidase-like regulatory domain-containing protein [Phnomibacter sp.]|nr:carboxypeptidase-like regulatory domain-containing protein [Phnomibacter sp.]